MKKQTRCVSMRVLALLLACALVMPGYASAALPETVEPMGSDYFSYYSAYIGDDGNDAIKIHFTVNGTAIMDMVGVSNIELFESTDNENWTLVKTFDYWDYPSMMGYNKGSHTNNVTYSGVSGRYYKAYMWLYSGKNGSGETRTIYAYMV